MTIRTNPEYCYRLSDLPRKLKRGNESVRRGLKAVYNANVASVTPAEAIDRALAWADAEGLL